MWWEYDEGRVDEFWKWRDLKGGELIRFWNIQVGQVFGLISLQNSNSASTPRNNLKPDQVKEKKKNRAVVRQAVNLNRHRSNSQPKLTTNGKLYRIVGLYIYTTVDSTLHLL